MIYNLFIHLKFLKCKKKINNNNNNNNYIINKKKKYKWLKIKYFRTIIRDNHVE